MRLLYKVGGIAVRGSLIFSLIRDVVDTVEGMTDRGKVLRPRPRGPVCATAGPAMVHTLGRVDSTIISLPPNKPIADAPCVG